VLGMLLKQTSKKTLAKRNSIDFSQSQIITFKNLNIEK